VASACQLCDASLYAWADATLRELDLTDDVRRIDAYIVVMSVLSLVILYPIGNLKAVDAYFFGASASTESGLNTYVPLRACMVESLASQLHGSGRLTRY